MAKIVTARALVALANFAVESGDLLQAPDSTIAALADAGLVDPDPSAVAYAQVTNAKVVKIAGADAAAAEHLGAAMTNTPAAADTPVA